MPSSETRLLTIRLRISPPMAAGGLVPASAVDMQTCPAVQSRRGCGRQGCIFQPVAQTLADASAPQDLALPWAAAPDIGVEKVLVPFMRQADLYIAALEVNVLNCRCVCGLDSRSAVLWPGVAGCCQIGRAHV